jgi:ATP-dependent protease Clp ATPase subunit
MVAGPGIYICNRCVELAVEVLEKRGVPIDR